MKKSMMLSIILFFMFHGIGLADAPKGVGGFVLGKHIKEYKQMLKMETATSIRNQQYIHELETKEIAGFKTGYISFGNCSELGRIVRIKLKYLNSTKKFYNSLLKRFKKKFGEPSEWRGDPFHVVIAWKWSFIDNDNNRISLILQHNTKDQEEKMGNSVKLNMTNLIEEERLCYEKKSDESGTSLKSKTHETKNKLPINWDLFIPR
ncbi:MAG: hypothetical protein JSV38_00360 [Desulfobacterales bacterium]|nr:MAG: hypothetical protein JSV38_00360 [Desulfobacterales bacterium]